MLNYDDYFNPVLQALRDLGGSGSNQEITDKVCSNLQLSDEDIEKMHGNSNQTEVDYRIAWAKTYLKKYGILENSQRGIWSFVNDKKNIETVDKEEVKAFVKKLDKKDKSSKNIELEIFWILPSNP